MGRKKKMSFQLNPEWMLKEPIDFEYNKYTLLDYLQKCEKRFSNLEIYPDFVELSLHLANIQTLAKENKVFLTNKKFESCDDEILLKDLSPKDIPSLSDQDEDELDKTLRYSGYKLLDTFNLGKSIWSLAYDNVDVFLRKNVERENISLGYGYSFYYQKEKDTLYVWEYYIKKDKKTSFYQKVIFKEIYRGEPTNHTLTEIVEEYSSFNKTKFQDKIPVFETRSYQSFPIEQTLLPIMKRKIIGYISQTINSFKLKNFDFEL